MCLQCRCLNPSRPALTSASVSVCCTSSVRSALFGSTPPQFRADLSGLLDRLALLHSGDVPASDEGAEPAPREVESQLEVARPKEACSHLVSMDCSEVDAAQLTVLLNAVAGLVGGGAGRGIHEAPVVSWAHSEVGPVVNKRGGGSSHI